MSEQGEATILYGEDGNYSGHYDCNGEFHYDEALASSTSEVSTNDDGVFEMDGESGIHKKVSLVLAIDRSVNMSIDMPLTTDGTFDSTRMEAVLNGAKDLVKELQDEESASVILFDDEVDFIHCNYPRQAEMQKEKMIDELDTVNHSLSNGRRMYDAIDAGCRVAHDAKNFCNSLCFVVVASGIDYTSRYRLSDTVKQLRSLRREIENVRVVFVGVGASCFDTSKIEKIVKGDHDLNPTFLTVTEHWQLKRAFREISCGMALSRIGVDLRARSTPKPISSRPISSRRIKRSDRKLSQGETGEMTRGISDSPIGAYAMPGSNSNTADEDSLYPSVSSVMNAEVILQGRTEEFLLEDPVVPSVPPSKPGSLVVLKGLLSASGASLNGKMGCVLESDREFETVRILDGGDIGPPRIFRLRSTNIEAAENCMVMLDSGLDPILASRMGTIRGYDATSGSLSVNVTVPLRPSDISLLPKPEELA